MNKILRAACSILHFNSRLYFNLRYWPSPKMVRKGGAQSDGERPRKNSAKVAGGAIKALMALDFRDGSMAYHHSYGAPKFKKALEEGRARIFIAGDLYQAACTRLKDIEWKVPVLIMEDWYEMPASAIKARTLSGHSYNSVRAYTDALVSEYEAGKLEGKKMPSICAGVHFTFEDKLPKKFNIITYGEPFTRKVDIPAGLEVLGLNPSAKEQMAVDVDPAELKFLDSEVHTAWTPSNQMKVRWELSLPAEKEAQILFRYRLASAGQDSEAQRLRLEMLVLPAGTTLESFQGVAAKTVEDVTFPGVAVFIKSNPITWVNDDFVHLHHHFVTPTYQCGLSEERRAGIVEDMVVQEELLTADCMPEISDVAARRLLWEISHKFCSGATGSQMHRVQQSYIKSLLKNPSHYVPVNTQPLQLAGLKLSPNGAAGDAEQDPPEDPEEPEVEEPEVVEPPRRSSRKRTRISSAEESQVDSDPEQEEEENSPPARPVRKKVPGPAPAKKKVAGPARQKSRTELPEVPSDQLEDEENDLEGGAKPAPRKGGGAPPRSGAGGGTKPPTKKPPKVPVYYMHDGRVNEDHELPEKGKNRLLSAPLKTGSRYSDKVPMSESTLKALAISHPRANNSDLYHIHGVLASSLAKSSKSSVRSAGNAFTRVFGSEDWLHNPMSGDQEIILSRMLRQLSISRLTALQYMKNYSANLELAGKDVPPETAAYRRMKKGVRKMLVDPIEDVATAHRQAYNLTSLELAILAFKRMVKLGLWSREKSLMHQAILTLCFWGRFRTGEVLVPAQNNIILEDSILGVDVTLIEEQESFVRVWLRKEKATAHRGGSLVEIPKLPANMARLCAFRAMRKYLRYARSYGLTSFDPVFTRSCGKAMTPARFSEGVKEAITHALPPMGKELFKVLKNHSTRSAVPTLCQELKYLVPPEILKNLGRWESNAYTAYLKNFGAAMDARRFIEKEIIDRIATEKAKNLFRGGE